MSRSTLKNLILSVTLFLITGVGFLIYLHQFNQKSDTLTEQIVNLATQREQEKSFFQLQKIAEEASLDIESLYSYFLHDEGGSIDLLNRLEGLAPGAGVKTDTIDLKTVTDEKKLDWVEIDLSVKGEREPVQNFIQAVDELPYVSKVVSLNLKSVNSSQWQAVIKFRVMVLNYDE